MKNSPANSHRQNQRVVTNYVFDLMDALSSPILTFSSLWADTLPKRILDIIPISRLKALMADESMATYAECVVYLYTRSLEAPMDRDWTDIYLYVSCQTMKEWFEEDHSEHVQAPHQLNDWLLSQLNRLRRDIYPRRRDALKKKLKDQNNAAKL